MRRRYVVFGAALAVLMALASLGMDRLLNEPQSWRDRLARHSLQLRACLDARGVPMFDAQNLFERCVWPEGGR